MAQSSFQKAMRGYRMFNVEKVIIALKRLENCKVYLEGLGRKVHGMAKVFLLSPWGPDLASLKSHYRYLIY